MTLFYPKDTVGWHHERAAIEFLAMFVYKLLISFIFHFETEMYMRLGETIFPKEGQKYAAAGD